MGGCGLSVKVAVSGIVSPLSSFSELCRTFALGRKDIRPFFDVVAGVFIL